MDQFIFKIAKLQFFSFLFSSITNSFFHIFAKNSRMFKILNKIIGLQWVLLLILITIAGIQIFSTSRLMDPTGFPILYKSIYNILYTNTIVKSITISTILILSLLGVQYYFSKNNFASKSSLLPAIIYLSILVLTGSLKVVSPIFFTNFSIIVILLLNESHYKGLSRINVFYSGMFIGISLFIDPASIVLLLFLIVSMIINTVITPKDLIVSILGIVTIGIYLVAYYFFIDGLEILWANFDQIKWFAIFTTARQLSSLQLIFTLLNFIIIFYLVIKVSLVYENKVIVMRKKIITLNALLLCLMGTILVSGISPEFLFRYFYIPVSLLISILVQSPNRFFIYEILIGLLYIGLCL